MASPIFGNKIMYLWITFDEIKNTCVPSMTSMSFEKKVRFSVRNTQL